jgi:hypothetical protein
MTCCGQRAIGMGAATPPVAVEAAKDGIVRHCDVCAILDGNYQPKLVRYCQTCDKFMCAVCRGSAYRRGLAFFSWKLSGLLQRTA